MVPDKKKYLHVKIYSSLRRFASSFVTSIGSYYFCVTLASCNSRCNKIRRSDLHTHLWVKEWINAYSLFVCDFSSSSCWIRIVDILFSDNSNICHTHLYINMNHFSISSYIWMELKTSKLLKDVTMALIQLSWEQQIFDHSFVIESHEYTFNLYYYKNHMIQAYLRNIMH